jgi:hypothetical protein
MPRAEGQSKLSARVIAAQFALAAMLAPVTGPGSAAVAALVAFDGGHRVAVLVDGAHTDVVLCHEADAGAHEIPVLRDAGGCSDDHRFHLVASDVTVARGHAVAAQVSEGGAALAAPCPPAPSRLGRSSLVARPAVARSFGILLKPSVVLQV